MSEEMNQAEPLPTPQPQKQFDFVESEDGIFRTYTNHHMIGWTGYDVRLVFGELVEVTDDKLIIEQTAHITMSWPQAKVLLASLQDLIGKYEKLNGSIIPPTIP